MHFDVKNIYGEYGELVDTIVQLFFSDGKKDYTGIAEKERCVVQKYKSRYNTVYRGYGNWTPCSRDIKKSWVKDGEVQPATSEHINLAIGIIRNDIVSWTNRLKDEDNPWLLVWISDAKQKILALEMLLLKLAFGKK